MEMTLWTNKDPINQHHHITALQNVSVFYWPTHRQYKKDGRCICCLTGLKTFALFIMVSRGRLLLLQQEVQLHRNLSENSSFSHLIYELGKRFYHLSW